MVILGIVMLVIGYLVGIHLLVTLGVILVVIGLLLMLVGGLGHPVGGRNYWW